MAEIKRITIAGFRGIRGKLNLNFQKGNSIRSMVIYGRNGTGKSSITDAWEWFHTERIEHLRREGARESSYPHKNATEGETYVEIEFSKSDLGTQKLDFNHSRITIPTPSGDILAFRQLVPHPCHIRFEDLTNFVYKSKTEKFDALALLMGFMPQVELQKALRRVLRKFTEKIDEETAICNELQGRLVKVINIEEIDESNFISFINSILAKYDISESDSLVAIKERKNQLNKMVIDDPIAQEISDLNSIENTLQFPELSTEFKKDYSNFLMNARELVSNKQEVSKLLLLKIFEQGDILLSQVDEDGNNIYKQMTGHEGEGDICPLCGQIFLGDLGEHIASEAKKLQEIKSSRDSLTDVRKDLQRQIPVKNSYKMNLINLGDRFQQFNAKYDLTTIITLADKVESQNTILRNAMTKEVNEYTDQCIDDLEKFLTNITEEIENLKMARSDLQDNLNDRLKRLSQDKENRSRLVEDNSLVSNTFESFIELQQKKQNLQLLEQRRDNYQKIVDAYISASIKNVSERFEIISEDLNNYFEILEKDTPGLKSAKLKLLPEEDRSVVLEVGFHDDTIFPAYKYLSESQLNSFGLSVFLASAKYFNSDFKFIILDDIINSFDGYKRPRIIELLKTEFSTHQILLLTHDNVWCDRLFEAFPTSIRKRFTRWEINHGPVESEGYTPLEKIQQYINNDEPVEAGRNLGPTLERYLQEIAEEFEVLVQYSRTNEYSLSPLLQRFKARVKDKLSKEHLLWKAIVALEEEQGFRNLCAHWKDPAIQLTSPEVQEVLDKWLIIESYVKCQDPNCMNWLRYDSSSSSFICPCGKTSLTK